MFIVVLVFYLSGTVVQAKCHKLIRLNRKRWQYIVACSSDFSFHSAASFGLSILTIQSLIILFTRFCCCFCIGRRCQCHVGEGRGWLSGWLEGGIAYFVTCWRRRAKVGNNFAWTERRPSTKGALLYSMGYTQYTYYICLHFICSRVYVGLCSSTSQLH